MNLADLGALLFPALRPQRALPALALTECVCRRCGHGAALAQPASSSCPVCRATAWVARPRHVHRSRPF